jgi:hypothetical protein
MLNDNIREEFCGIKKLMKKRKKKKKRKIPLIYDKNGEFRRTR